MEIKTTKFASPQVGTPRRIYVGPAQKGLMQKFIHSRAKSLTDSNNNNINEKGSPITADALLLKKGSPIVTEKKLRYHQSIYSHKPFPLVADDSPIERDENGKPIRRGYIPAEEKIQKELSDFRCREFELRQNRRSSSLSSQPDLVASIKSDVSEIPDDCQSIVPSVTSISEFNDSLDSVFSGFSENTSLNSSFNYHQIHKLPLSKHLSSTVATLSEEFLELEAEENKQISSKKLIAKWEIMIKESARK